MTGNKVTFISSTEYVIVAIDHERETFVARRTYPSGDDETDFAIEEVSEKERGSIRVGANFVVRVYYEDRIGGQRGRVSVLEFPSYLVVGE